MSKIFISEANIKQNNISFLYNNLNYNLINYKAKIDLAINSERIIATVNYDDKYEKLIKNNIEDKIAEVIVISYKYLFFKENLKIVSIPDIEYEILLSSLISADFKEDKEYVKNQLKDIEIYSIDGFYNFRLNLLKQKWQDIISYIPSYFSKKQLIEFISFLTNDCANNKVYIKNNLVYDKFYNKLNRSSLLNINNNYNLVTELILSCCSEIEFTDNLPLESENYIIDIFKNKIKYSNNPFLRN